jgi:hypothetical protein
VYLFEDKDEVEIPVKCKVCLSETKFIISTEDYKNFNKFPIRKEFVHGDPEHKLVIFLNKFLEIENFQIEELVKEEASRYEELTKQVLSDIDLTADEITLYFTTTGRDAVSIGEMMILIDKTKEECSVIAEKFVEKGLFKKIVGTNPHYIALPPYAALSSQIKNFQAYISEIKENAPTELNESFSELEAQAEGLKRLKDYSDYMMELKENIHSKIVTQKQEFSDTISNIEKIKDISDDILNLGNISKDILDSQVKSLVDQFQNIYGEISKGVENQISELSGQFENIINQISQSLRAQVLEINTQFVGINSKISGIMKKQLEDLGNQIKNIQSRISKNLEKLELGILQQTVDQVMEKIFSLWLKSISESFNKQMVEIASLFKDGIINTAKSLKKALDDSQQITEESLTKTTLGLKNQLELIQNASKEGLEKTSEEFNKVIGIKLKNSIDDTINNIEGITNSTAKSGDEIKKIFTEISDSFTDVILTAGEKLSGITDEISQSFGSLRETFSTKVISTLDTILLDILNKLELNEITIKEFWDKAKQVSIMTMQDIWFLRSEEAAKAQITEQLFKVKARILIVAPKITDINVEAVLAVPKKVQVRIATRINLDIEKHVEIFEKFEGIEQIKVRQREEEDLWGVNKDYEEVIICVISKARIGKDIKTEIAGIGTTTEAHIKILVPVLEDAWLKAHKKIEKE